MPTLDQVCPLCGSTGPHKCVRMDIVSRLPLEAECTRCGAPLGA